MLKWILGIVGGLVWCALVFVLTLWLTFPSQALVDRAAFEVQKASDGDYALKAASASPWWTGLSMSDVQLVAVDRDAGTSQLMLEADHVSARTSLFGLLGSSLPVHAVVGLGGSELVIDGEVDRSGPRPFLSRLRAVAPALSVQALGGLVAPFDVTLSGDGDLDVDVDFELGKAVADHDGRLSVRGKGLTLTIAMPDPLSGGDSEFTVGPMSVTTLDLVLDVKDGKAILKKGDLRSDIVTMGIDGQVNLNDKIARSRARGELTLSDLGGQIATFEPFMASAKGADGAYHYRITCTLGRFNSSCIRPAGRRGGARRGRRPSIPVGNSAAGDEDPAERAARLREERRKAREERLAERRARIAEEREGREPPRRPGMDDDEPLDDEEDEFIDEEEDDFDPENGGVPMEPDIVAPPPELNLADPAGMGLPEPNLPPDFED